MKPTQSFFESQLPSFSASVALDSCDYDDSMSCDTLRSLSPRHVDPMDTLSSEHCDSVNFIGAYSVSVISFATEMDQTDIAEPKSSSVIYDEMPTMMLQECFNIWDIPRPEPEGLGTQSAISTNPCVSDVTMDGDCDDELMHFNRDSYMDISMYSDEHYVVPTNTPVTPHSSCVNPIDVQIGSRPECIGQEVPSLSPTSARTMHSNGYNRTDTLHEELASPIHLPRRAQRYMDKSMCSDVSAFMDRPLCRRGVVKENQGKISRQYKRSITQKLKKFGKKVHGFTSARSLPTLAVL